MRVNFASRMIFVLATPIALASCVSTGPSTLREERLVYNEAIHDTGTQQLLFNIVRAHYFETPSFSTLAEVDTQPSAGFALTGSVAGIGANSSGGIGPSISASELSIQKNVTLAGYELIQQISRPITLQNIQRLQYANQPTYPTFRYSFNNIGPASEYNRALIAMSLLDVYGAIQIESRTENTMTITVAKQGLITTPLPGLKEDGPLKCLHLRGTPLANVSKLSRVLTSILKPENDQIVLRSPDAKLAKERENELDVAESKPSGNIVFTRSAIGALDMAQSHEITITPHDQADMIRRQNRAVKYCFTNEFYLMPNDQNSVERLWDKFFDSVLQNDAKLSILEAREVGAATALILVDTSPEPLSGAYVSIQKGDTWYSIAGDDDISKRNLDLLNSILTVQAVSSPSKDATQTTISAGK